MGNVYLDTTFFTAALQNQAGRRAEARKIIEYEKAAGSHFYTSVLTVNEFLIYTYNEYRESSDCEDRVGQTLQLITEIASLYGFSVEVCKHASLIQSVWGEIHKHIEPQDPRDRHFRWDAIHLATANKLRADRVYGWDNSWNHVPKELREDIGELIIPAACPQSILLTLPPDSPIEPEPPAEQSPAAPEDSEPSP